MAKALRSKSTNVFVWILLLLLIVGLAGFGAGSFGGSFSSVGSVGDEKVSIKSYIRALNNQINQISQQTGQLFSLDQARVLGVDRQVLEQVLAIAALDGQVKKAGISVGDSAVKSQLLDIQAFKGLNGKFDEKAYEFALKQADLSASEYDELLRKENARLLLQNAVSGGIRSNDTYALTLLKFHRQTRKFNWTELNVSYLERPIKEPSGSEIEKFYSENQDKYTTPEAREITYAYLSPKMLLKGIVVEKEELEKLYNENINQYVIEEKRTIRQLIFSNQSEATKAYGFFKNGTKTFEQLVIDRGLTLEDINLGNIGASDLSLQASESIFKSKEIGIYGPFPSDLGPALYQVTAVLDGKSTSFEEALPNLEFEKKAEYARQLIDDMISDLDDLLASGATIEELASDTEMELEKTSFNLDNKINGIEASPEFKIEANKISTEDYPTLLNTSDGSIFSMRLDAISPPNLQALEIVKNQVIIHWKQAETVKQLKLIADDIAQKVRNGASLKELGFSVNDAENILRSSTIDGLPQSMIKKLFNFKLGEIAIDESKKSIFIAELNEITDFDETAAENKKWIEYLSSQRRNQLGQDYLESFIVAIQDLEGMTIDQKSLNAVQASVGSSQ